MIRTIDAYRATGGDVADLLGKTVKAMDAYRANGGNVEDLLTSTGAGSRLDYVHQFLNHTEDCVAWLDAD